jgi:hypothetical protein
MQPAGQKDFIGLLFQTGGGWMVCGWIFFSENGLQKNVYQRYEKGNEDPKKVTQGSFDAAKNPA